MTSNNDDDEENGHRGGRPNAYWAKIREEEEAERDARERGDTFGGAFRATRPVPHGGAVTVTADKILGAEELCWCGQPVGHSWPGKSVGAKHPKVGKMSVTSSETIDRRDLRAFHRRLQDFVLHCITEDGVKFRQTKNSVILYPPDGTTPMTVHARNTDRQLRQLAKWYADHVRTEPEEAAEEVSPEDLKRLAEVKNDPAEHPQQPKQELQYQEEPAKPEDYLPEPPKSPEPEPEPEAVSPNDGTEEVRWVPHVRDKGRGGESPNIVTNGTQYRCLWCAGTDHEFLANGAVSVGGHNRMYHTDTANMYGPEARARATETLRAKKLQSEKIVQAIDLLAETIGYTVSPSALADWEAKFNDMEHKFEAMKNRAEKAEQREQELEAKLALVREATGL
jgi:hypothetical protein